MAKPEAFFQFDAATRLLRGSEVPPTEAAVLGEGLLIASRQILTNGLEVQSLIQCDQVEDISDYPPLERWHDGHVLFTAVQQASIRIHKKLADALRDGDLILALQLLRDAAVLFHAGAVSLRQTGAMSREDYETIVRPTMAPPFVRERFSGTWMAEHRRLLRLAHGLVDIPGARAPGLLIGWNSYFFALNAAYAAHRFCCERVTGEQSSLAARFNPNAPAAHDSLSGFASRALRGAGYRPPANENDPRAKKGRNS